MFSRFSRSILLITGLVAFIAACSPEQEEAAALIRPVKTVLAVPVDSIDVRVFPGQTKAAEQVTLSFQVPGKIESLPALNGQMVKKGELIAQLDDRDYASKAKAARAELERAESEFRRIETLLDSKLISKSEYDQRKAARDIAEANLEQATKALNDTKLVAPFSGRVAQRYVENYEDVTAKQAVASLQSVGNSKIVFHVPEKEIMTNSRNIDNYRFEASFLKASNKRYLLEFIEFTGITDPRSQTFEAVFQLLEEPDFDVLSGVSISVTMTKLQSAKEDVVIRVPSSAVFADQSGAEGQFIWVVDEIENTATVRRVPVNVGRLQQDQIEIIDGLNAGERVVTAGVHYLYEGQEVSILAEASEF